MKRLIVGAILSLGVTQPARAASYWYYCDPAQAYYPYVMSCSAPWRAVIPTENSPQQAPSPPPTPSPIPIAPPPTPRSSLTQQSPAQLGGPPSPQLLVAERESLVCPTIKTLLAIIQKTETSGSFDWQQAYAQGCKLLDAGTKGVFPEPSTMTPFEQDQLTAIDGMTSYLGKEKTFCPLREVTATTPAVEWTVCSDWKRAS